MSFVQIGSRMGVYGFVLAIFFSLPLTIPTQKNINLPDYSGIKPIEIARGDRVGGGHAGGVRSGSVARMSCPSGNAARSALDSRFVEGLRSSLRNKPFLRSGELSQATQGPWRQQIQHPPVGMRGSINTMSQQPSSPVARPGQRPSPSQQPTSSWLNTGKGLLPSQRPVLPDNRPSGPTRPNHINQINTPRSINVEGHDGGCGCQTTLGDAAAGMTGGSVLNSLASNS